MAALITTEETDLPAAEIVSKATLRVYESGGHGLAQFQAGPFNQDVLYSSINFGS
ncbi:MAG: hypothetical protein PVF97_08365 [Desulfobacterales bacterium]|jgi:hypothetical protein